MECKPLKNLSELFSWQPKLEFIREPKFRISRSNTYLDGKQWTQNKKNWDWLVKNPLKKEDGTKPRTLVCHDMMGGYQTDRFLDPALEQDGYSFLHWNSLDVFVYFSHNFVTIPPTGWIVAGKTHGVKVLGTIITEWKEGKQILEEILRDESKIDAFVEKCSDIASFYGFQGWLLNIENPVDWTLVPYLLELVKKLTDKTHQIYGDSGMVLWYDSVTIQGDLQWQNELNMLNKPFMDNCDGIFLNYIWKAPDLNSSFGGQQRHSLVNSVQSLDNISRRTHIFVGIDVFGRGCLGGGGLNCDVALQKIRDLGLSTAIFAPGWTYESSLTDKVLHRDYLIKEHLFWSKLDPYLSFHALKIDLKSDSKEPRLIFETNFHTGRKKDSFHLLSVETQPSLPCVDHQTMRETVCSEDMMSSISCISPSFNPPALTTYSCHTTDPKIEGEIGLNLFCSSGGVSGAVPGESNVTVPILLVELLPEDSQILFVVYGSSSSTQIQDSQLILGTDKGVELEGDKLEAEILHMLVPSLQHSKQNLTGFLVENCYDTIQKIGLRFTSHTKFNLSRLAIYRL